MKFSNLIHLELNSFLSRPNISEICRRAPQLKSFTSHFYYSECIIRGEIYHHEQDLLGRITQDVQEYTEQQPKIPNKLAETASVESFFKQVAQFLQCCFEARKDIKAFHHISTTAQ